MADSDFVKMEKSDNTLPGNRQLIVCGFKPKEQELLKKLITKCHIDVALVFPTTTEQNLTLDEINNLPDGTGAGVKSPLVRAVIAAGVSEKEFHRLLERYKKGSLPRPLWATLTETSREWELLKLLGELSKERAMMG